MILPNGAKETSVRCLFVGTESGERHLESQHSPSSELKLESLKFERLRFPIKASIENAVAFVESCGLALGSNRNGPITCAGPSEELESSLLWSIVWNFGVLDVFNKEIDRNKLNHRYQIEKKNSSSQNMLSHFSRFNRQKRITYIP